jgi:hypothetical protein
LAYRIKSLSISFLLLLGFVALNAAPVVAGDVFLNPQIGYEMQIISDDFVADYTGYPDTMVWQVGDEGRLIISSIELEDEYDELTAQDYIDYAVSGLQNNFDEFTSISEGSFTSRNGLEAYEISFDFVSDYEIYSGIAQVVSGDQSLLALYYDVPSEYEYYRNDVCSTFETIRVDESIIDETAVLDASTDAAPVEFIDPLQNIYKNELFNYECTAPVGISAEEITGPAWIIFPLGEGEIAIHYLDAYFGTGETADTFIEEVLPEILVSFSSYEITLEEAILSDDGRDGYLVDITAILNGMDWSGSFTGFVSDDDEPFLISILAPDEEFDIYKSSFDNLWKSFTFITEY